MFLHVSIHRGEGGSVSRGSVSRGVCLYEVCLQGVYPTSQTNLHDSLLEALLLAGDEPVGVSLALSLALVVGIHVGAVPMRGSNSVVLLRLHSKTHTAGREREYDVNTWL